MTTHNHAPDSHVRSELPAEESHKSHAFEPIASYERLIKLREESPDQFLLRTSQATRAALGYYERQKRMSE